VAAVVAEAQLVVRLIMLVVQRKYRKKLYHRGYLGGGRVSKGGLMTKKKK
jgi:hypothetical protein